MAGEFNAHRHRALTINFSEVVLHLHLAKYQWTKFIFGLLTNHQALVKDDHRKQAGKDLKGHLVQLFFHLVFFHLVSIPDSCVAAIDATVASSVRCAQNYEIVLNIGNRSHLFLGVFF